MTAKLLIHTHDRAAAITGTVWGASDTGEFAVETAPTRRCITCGSGLDREAFDSHARLGSGYYRDCLGRLRHRRARGRDRSYKPVHTRRSGLDREAFDSNHNGALAITGTVWGASDTVELAVETAPTRLCTPVGAVLTSKLLIHQTTTGQRLIPGRLGRLRHRRARGRDRSHKSVHTRGSGLDREAFDSHARPGSG